MDVTFSIRLMVRASRRSRPNRIFPGTPSARGILTVIEI